MILQFGDNLANKSTKQQRVKQGSIMVQSQVQKELESLRQQKITNIHRDKLKDGQ